MKKVEPRSTIFCAGNEKMLYPPVQGRRRVAEKIFESHGFDAKKSIAAEVSFSETKTKNYSKRNDQSFSIPTQTGLAKGGHQRDFLSQSVDYNTYGIFSFRKKVESRDNNLQTEVSAAELSELKYKDPAKKDRIAKYMDSTGIKKSLSMLDQLSVPSTPKRQNPSMSSSTMRETLCTPKNGNYKSLKVTGKVTDST